MRIHSLETNATMSWSDEAVEIFSELLRNLPPTSRAQIEDTTSARAEALAKQQNDEEVAMETVITALVESTPQRLRPRLREALTYHGIDPEEYDTAFASEG
ncbi:MAG TPA: DUF2621 family protein [candidate division Zixibacteria bacterium]|nr:DUF2621 family protein [candidate division Zixibacteria bacterium]